MSNDLPMTVIRRLVTGTDEQGRSTIVWDGPAPNAGNAALAARTHCTNIWVWDRAPMPLSGTTDEGDTPYEFPGPRGGGHVRVVETLAAPEGYDPATDPDATTPHDPKPRPSNRSWDRGGKNIYSAGMHKTQSVDFGIMLAGERELTLDDQTLMMEPGDIAIQVGAWHNWSSPRLGCVMAFDMIDAEFVDGEQGLVQGNDPVIEPPADYPWPDGVKLPRRIVTTDREPGRSSLVSDGPPTLYKAIMPTGLRVGAPVGDRSNARQDRAGDAASAPHDRTPEAWCGLPGGDLSAGRELGG